LPKAAPSFRATQIAMTMLTNGMSSSRNSHGFRPAVLNRVNVLG
jgi:hypothetical protein